MKFVRREHLITTIFNKELKDDETIFGVLGRLLEKSIDFILLYRKMFTLDYEYRTMSHSRVRVKAIHLDSRTVDFHVWESGAMLTINGISIDDVVEINAITTQSKILDTTDDPSRFEILDLS